MSNITKRLNTVLNTMNDKQITDYAYKTFKDITPIDTGYARSQTLKSNNEITANYPYAKVLDKGRHMTNRGMRGSPQAPEGMSKPTMRAVKEYIYLKTGIRI